MERNTNKDDRRDTRAGRKTDRQARHADQRTTVAPVTVPAESIYALAAQLREPGHETL